MEQNRVPRWGLILGGLAAGAMNGLLGAGGGVILVFLLRAALGPKTESRDVYASALITTLPVTLISDGHLLSQNLSLVGKDLSWLQKVLRSRETTLKDTWLLTVDAGDNILWYPKEDSP